MFDWESIALDIADAHQGGGGKDEEFTPGHKAFALVTGACVLYTGYKIFSWVTEKVF